MSERRKSCPHLVHALETFSNDLMGNLQRFVSIGDTSGVGTIWACCVLCLAHLAALCHFMSQTDPTSSTFMNDLYDQTLDNLCNLSLQIHIEGYLRFEVLTGVRIHNNLFLRMRQTLIKLPSVTRCLGKGRWTPFTRVSDRARTQRTGRCETGKGSSKRRTPIFKRIFKGVTLTRLLAWCCQRMVVWRAQNFRICWSPRKGSVTDFDAGSDHVSGVPGRYFYPAILGDSTRLFNVKRGLSDQVSSVE